MWVTDGSKVLIRRAVDVPKIRISGYSGNSKILFKDVKELWVDHESTDLERKWY